MSLFTDVTAAPADPILGLTEKFNADTDPRKVNLGVGVYQDETGKLPLLAAVRAAEERLAAEPKPRGYLPIDGMKLYDDDVKALVFGEGSDAVTSGRTITIQALGGTGALKIGADFLKFLNPDARVLISTPSWENHRALFTRAGIEVGEYRYYDPARRGIDVDGMLADLRAAASGTIVLLHACCHNPTGYDLTPAQWDEVIAVVKAGGLVPFLDMAYQGFAKSLEEDGAVVRKFVDAGLSFFCSTSFSKSFSLYGERVGALSIVCADADEAKRVLSQVKIVVRTNYSNPPTHGAALVETVLKDADLRALWVDELAAMRDRIKEMRQALVAGLEAEGVTDFGFIAEQVGMFSYSGLTKDQMIKLREEHHVYGTDAGRICVAALNAGNVEYVSKAIAAVL
ncbi:amino acid aminotransferase [Propioniciclava tarda]|uniref:Aminotransferase n=1 Tax=Propioniciclava tarda TaxID=433330 RepID=A0A4V2JT94_PROTD|nr:amino acid aminotransferase [Propioniciclava tarda]TBT95461.1 aspartate/tyrosine/aromatic aminotransferase [Propioniciclava tarda]SMO49698.1 aromatic-amino-acid transaminase [Propioniciclava tarda]HOA88773.1 amino acid aminotransferase [Propioniciclava tarda]HQA31103.1 amino acid aminotransferase [Propioniciclava tarda]HQD60437.1 amino acid aminotransferase [Propioniciclava tarda]